MPDASKSKSKSKSTQEYIYDIINNKVRAGDTIASAHRKGDLPELRVGVVLAVHEDLTAEVEWQATSAQTLPGRPARIKTDRILRITGFNDFVDSYAGTGIDPYADKEDSNA